MRRYKMLSLGADKYGLRVQCTSPETLNWISGEVTQVVPSARVSWHRDLEGVAFWGTFKELQRKDSEICWLLFRKLCDQGWQPLSGNYQGERASALLRWKE